MAYGDGKSQAYTFDAMGNRTEKDDTTGSGASGLTTLSGYAYDAANRLTATTGTGAAMYTSDADGNTTADGSRTNTWDGQNRLAQCVAVDGDTTHYNAYTYGADGLRRSQTAQSEYKASPLGGGETNGVGTGDGDDGPVASPLQTNTTYSVYDGSMLVREMRKVGGVLTPTATYLQGPRGPEYRRDDTQAEGTYTDGTGTHAAGRTRWYVYDGLGSVVGEVDPSGNLTSSGTYDVYGAKRAGGSTGTATTKQGFVGSLGHVSDSETGLVYMRARYYDPNVGRFISEDPSRDGGNWFVYADNNPVNEVDQTGEEGETNPYRAIEDTAAALVLLHLAWALLALTSGGNKLFALLSVGAIGLLSDAASNIGVAEEIRHSAELMAAAWMWTALREPEMNAGAQALTGGVLLALGIISTTEMLYANTITGD